MLYLNIDGLDLENDGVKMLYASGASPRSVLNSPVFQNAFIFLDKFSSGCKTFKGKRL